MIVIGIIGFTRSRNLKKKHKEEIEAMRKYDKEISRDLPFNAHWEFGDSNYQKYKDNSAWALYGLIFLIVFILALLGIINIK